MRPDDATRDDDRARQIALFRYGVLAPLLEDAALSSAAAPAGRVAALVREITERAHYLPGKGEVRIAERTLYAWLRLYRQGGLDALRPCRRKDQGRSRKIDAAILERAIELRKENERRTTTTLLDILKLEGSLDGKPRFHRATLDRALDRGEASRRRLKTLGGRLHIKMRFEDFGALWVGDYHHGPPVLAPDGTIRTSKLGAFLDHKTRYPVANRYYLDEQITSLRDSLLRALLMWGIPSKVYVDNGSVYRAEQLSYSLARLDCGLVHSKAYYSEGRGLIERWWQTADQFESEVLQRDEPPTLHELNSLWEPFRELRYCQAVHSEIGMTPAEAVNGQRARPLDPNVARELFLVREERTVHKKNGCVSVLGHPFLCDAALRGRRVEVRFDPADLSSVLILRDGKTLQRAFPQPINATPQPHQKPREAPAHKTDYLGLLRAEYDRQLLEQAKPHSYSEIPPDTRFELEQFCAVVADLAELAPLKPAARAELCSFWETFGPLSEPLVRRAVEHALRLHGSRRHVRVYLEVLRTLVLASLRNPDHKEDP